MPVFLNAKYPGSERRSGLNWPRVQARTLEESGSTFLHIGLVNNMADAAMGATEHQFLTLLQAAAGDMLVHVTLYALPEVARKAVGQRRMGSFYRSIEQLWEQPPEQYPDGLIITGREPLTPDLREEVYWPRLKRVLAWTQEYARSAVWSCLRLCWLSTASSESAGAKVLWEFQLRANRAARTARRRACKPARSSFALERRLRGPIGRERISGAHSHQRR